MRASNEASTSTELTNALFRSRPEAVLDLIAAVKGLHELSPQQLAKLMKDSGHNVVQHVAEDGSFIQVDMEKFARYLPLHLISVIMAWERDGNTFKYLLCGILLLHSMCDLATRVPKIEQILLDDMKVSEQLIDLVFYLLVFLGAYRKENNVVPNDIVLLHSALVACSLKLLTVIVSPQYQEVAQVLNAYYKVDIFIDAAFAAVCTDVNFLQKKLSAEMVDSSANTTPSAEETLNHLCQQCDSSLQFLQSLCQQKLFRECIVKNKELCGNGCVLILVLAVMNLKISPLYSTSLYIASVSRLKTKALSILLYLREAENVSYLDEVASNPGSQNFYEGTSSKNELGEAMEVDLVKEADSWQRAFSKMGMGKLFQPSDEQVFSMLPEDFKTFLTSDLAPQIMAELPKLSPRLTESLEQLMVKLHGWISSSQTAFDSEINTIKTVSSKLEEATRIQNHTIASYEAKLRHLDQEGAQLLEPIKGIVDNFERVQTLCMSLYDSNLKLAEATNRLGKQVELDRQSKDFESDVALFKVLFSNLQDSLDHTGKRLDSVDNRLDDIKKGEEALKLKLVEEVTAQVMKTVQQGIDERIEQRMEALKEPIANAILADMAEQLSEVQKQKATEALKVKLSKGTDRDVNGPDQVG